MPDLPHEARHRAGRQGTSRLQASSHQATSRHQAPGHRGTSRHQAPGKRQAPSKPGRIFAGLALPTAATVALMFCAAGAAVATSKTQTGSPGLVASARKSPQSTAAASAAMRARQVQATERAQAVETASEARAVQQNMSLSRDTAVARGAERKKIAAAAEIAKRAALAHSWRLPITDPVTTSGFGYRWGRLHAGEDFAVDVGTPLGSMSTGTVTFAGEESGFGNLVEIRYWDGTTSYYGHMSSISVNVGESVDPGEVVGESGNTGHSTGPHLHLEIHPQSGDAIDPLPWLADHEISP